MTQYETILKSMLENPSKKVWDARDFQNAKYFVGYEATARISELVKMYPTLLKVGKDGRFRTIEIDWEDIETIDLIKKILEK